MGQKRKDIGSNEKGKAKKKCRTVLKSPFSLELPNVPQKDYNEIVKLLKSALRGITRKPQIKTKYKGKEIGRDKVSGKKVKNSEENKLLTERKNSLVFGFNSVMRKLENDKIVCVFVNKNAKPKSLITFFSPVCNIKHIPLISIQNLNEVVCESDPLSSNKCLALALKSDVTDSQNPLHNLYEASCNALQIKMKGPVSNSQSFTNTSSVPKQNAKKSSIHIKSKQTAKSLLSQDDISKLHLKRISRTVRAFSPSVAQLRVKQNEMDKKLGDFIEVDDVKYIPTIEEENKRVAIANTIMKKVESQNIMSEMDLSDIPSNLMFSVDEQINETYDTEDRNDTEIVNYANKAPEGGIDEDDDNDETYVTAQVIKIRNNPDRKKGKTLLKRKKKTSKQKIS